MITSRIEKILIVILIFSFASTYASDLGSGGAPGIGPVRYDSGQTHHKNALCYRQQGAYVTFDNQGRKRILTGEYGQFAQDCAQINRDKRYYQSDFFEKVFIELTTQDLDGRTITTSAAARKLIRSAKKFKLHPEVLYNSIRAVKEFQDVPLAPLFAAIKRISADRQFLCEKQVTVVDLTAPNTVKRMYIFDFLSGKVKRARYQHANFKGKSGKCARFISNRKNSGASPPGAHIFLGASECLSGKCLKFSKIDQIDVEARNFGLLATSSREPDAIGAVSQKTMGQLKESLELQLGCQPLLYFYPDERVLRDKKNHYWHEECRP